MASSIKVVKRAKFCNQDVLITDPCYILKPGADSLQLENQIPSLVMNSTIYGDWICTIWQTSKLKECVAENAIGHFSADAGLVCVADANEVFKYNSKFKAWMEQHPKCAAIIPNFTGTVEFTLHGESTLRLYGVNNGKRVWIAGQTGV